MKRQNVVPNDPRLYYQHCAEAWTGDQFGREWQLGWSVYPNRYDPDGKAFAVYEDDGRGTGSFVADFDTLDAATAFVDELVAES